MPRFATARRLSGLTLSTLWLLGVALGPAAVAADPPGTAGTNLFTNPHLDTGVSGWENLGTWDPALDSDGNSHSGSLRLSTITYSGGCTFATQCVLVTPGTYELSGKVRVPADSYPAGAVAQIDVIWTQRADCLWGPTALGSGTTPYVPLDTTPQDAWVSATTGPLVAPEETQGALVYLNVCGAPKEPRRHKVAANFDDLVLKRIAPPPAPAEEP
jgi:hypothetical protein